MSKNNLVKKFIDYALGSGVLLLLGFISSPLSTRLFSPEEFGKFSMFLLYANIINIIILMGLDQSFIRYFYKEKGNQSRLLYHTLKIPLITCIVVSIILALFFEKVSTSLFGTIDVQLLVLFTINNFSMLIGRFALLVIRMQQKGKLYSIVQIGQKLSYILIILLLFIPLKNSFLTLVYAFVLSNIILAIIAIVFERKLWVINTQKLKDKRLNTSTKELLKFGAPLMFTLLVTWMFQSADRLFIQHYYNHAELGLYSAAFSIIALLNAVQNAFTTFWVPVAYEQYEKNGDNRIFFKNITNVVAFVMFLICILIIFFKDIIIFILGEEFREASKIMPFLVFMPLMYTISETTVLGINFMKKSYYHVLIACCVAGLNIVGNFLLVPRFGAVGAAISTGLAYIIFFSIRTFISNKLYHVDFNLKRIYLMIVCLLIFTTYATFNTFNTYYATLGVLNIIVLVSLYIKDILRILKK
ncbi:lipopolysaccharide biosynthesis protein [Bacillus paramycoides]|uniref:lipopolysaccharide biosynthesis protein n=1 Tax=Bacillus paramycoides TaxID=2026194 RepID=UPI002E2354B0|nr:oligosaccharide flippase family protein [Bacillus paramycoides]MED0988002.1 oligosaccharide flippase family protein [Bacillus paramycoides]